jgi:hypothetical protein
VRIRPYFFEILAAVLLLGSLGFLCEAVSFLARHDYVAAVLMSAVGVATMHVGVQLARLALVDRQ